MISIVYDIVQASMIENAHIEITGEILDKVTERNYDWSPRSSDQLSSCPLLAVSCQPDSVGAQQSNPTKRSKQLFVRSDLGQVAQGFQHQVVACVDNPPAAHLQG